MVELATPYTTPRRLPDIEEDEKRGVSQWTWIVRYRELRLDKVSSGVQVLVPEKHRNPYT